MQLRTHAQTAGVSLTAQQPYNNVVRVALQALAAVLGGTQSLHTNSLDETYALPTEESVTHRAAHPADHRPRVAAWTASSIRSAAATSSSTSPTRWSSARSTYIRRIDEMGGMIRAVEEQYPQREIGESAYRFQREVEQGERLIVGVNAFRAEKQPAHRAAQDRRAGARTSRSSA